MTSVSRHVHVQSTMAFGSIDRIAPDLGLRFEGEATNGSPPEHVTPNALWFTDPDGETHVYPLTEDGRKSLVQMLTGGVVLPGVAGG